MVFMINSKIIKKNLSETKISFNKNSHQLIQSYVNKNFLKIKSAVGCYNIEGPAKKFFDILVGRIQKTRPPSILMIQSL